MNQLREEDIQRIIDTYDAFEDSEKYSRVVGLDEIEENDWNLSVPRYVDIFDPPEPVNIQQVWNKLQELENQRQETEERLAVYLKELGYQ